MAQPTRALYPELIDEGGLAAVLQAALLRIGSAMRVVELDEGITPVLCVTVRSASRESQVFIAAEERLFLFDFWSRGVMLATGRTSDLENVARAIDRWVGSNCGTGDMTSAFDFVKAEPSAWSYEQGCEVEERWREYLATIPESIPELNAVVSAASNRPELRRLFPYTSLNRLCFSRCTGYPFTRDTPVVAPAGPEGYRVYSSAGKDLGCGSAEQVLDIVIENLPSGCGPAVAGTAEEIGRAH
jgi:hypothetical protein